MNSPQPDNTPGQDARQLQQAIQEHLQQGEIDKAKRTFSHGWKEIVPELPFRFHFMLTKTKAENVMVLHRLVAKGNAVPPLRLLFIGGRRKPKTVQVWTVGRPKLHLGDLPISDVKFLADIGPDADLYVPSLIEIKTDDDNKLRYVAVELARDEVRFCAGCGEPHEGPNVFCNACRSSDRATHTYLEETPIAFHEAIEQIAAAGEDNGEEIF